MATHPKSCFYADMTFSKALPDRRNALHNNHLAIHSLNGASERRVLRTESELCDALTDLFGLTLPDEPDLNAALTRMTIGAV
jgi:N-hydroxyarylamine O-acetyltransferase